MVHIGTTLYAVEANHGELDKITLDGHISRVADLSFFMGHIVPTSMAVGPDGNFYIGNLSTLPYLDGKAVILKVTPQGQVSIAATGLTTVLGVALHGDTKAPAPCMHPPSHPNSHHSAGAHDQGSFTCPRAMSCVSAMTANQARATHRPLSLIRTLGVMTSALTPFFTQRWA